jgi:hypothetical protein
MLLTAERLLGEPGVWLELPGGERRGVARLGLEGGRSVIVARRAQAADAAHEARVLRALRAAGAPVPEVLAREGRLLVQSDLGPHRLAQALEGVGPVTLEGRLDAALAALARVQEAGSAAGLDEAVPEHATSDRAWFQAMLGEIGVFCAEHALEPPVLPEEAIVALLWVERPRFIKWDARPANAALLADGSVAWFDFEDAVARCRLDDLVWLLADEYVPEAPAVEARLLERWLPVFADRLEPDRARDYVRTFGVFHALYRLGLILDRKGEGPWRSAEACLALDKPGITPEAARRLLVRAARWAEAAPLLEPLEGWLERFARRLPPAGLPAAA